MLCPTCFTQIKKEDKTCAQCGEELDDLTSGYLSIPDQLEQYSSIHDIFLSKLSLITTGIIIALALIRNEVNFLWLLLLKLILTTFILSYGLHKHYGKCFHGIPGGRSSGKCKMCNAGLIQRHKNLEEYQHNKAVLVECNQLRISEIRKIRIACNKKIDNLQNLDPFEFEKVIIEMYRKLGYEVKQTPLTNDHGMDGIAYKDGVKYLIECKRYASNNLVGRPDVKSQLSL